MKIQGLLELHFSTSHPEVVATKTDENGFQKTFTLSTNILEFGFFLKKIIQEALDEGCRVEWVKE